MQRDHVLCRSCNWFGQVTMSKHRNKGASVTGVPCPKCGKHKLRRGESLPLVHNGKEKT